MKRGMGVFALFAALLAGARWEALPSLPKAATHSGAPAQYVPEAVETKETSCSEFADQRDAKKSVSQGKLSTLVDRYLHGSQGPVEIGHRSLPEGIRFVVTTVPDPLHTHLNLQFDRNIEAIQQAAQDEGYTYDSSWLPWKQQAAAFSSRADQSAEEQETVRREQCPGLILFRKGVKRQTAQLRDASYNEGLFLFLVAEKPTLGIDRIQWNNALQWITLHADRNTFDGSLRVLGPTFSGSAPSVARALADVGKQKNDFSSVLLYSGTIRGCSAYEWLDDELHTSTGVPIRTADFEENDAIQVDRYFKYLHDRGHSLSEVAILSEDETTYGGLPDAHQKDSSRCEPTYSAKNRPLHLYYPRDISALRSAYQEQSIFAPSTSDASSTSHLVLQPPLTGSTHIDTDTVATYSGSNSALAQEAQMYGVVDSLRTHGIRFVILRSTSTLDYLFLTRFLHRAYPDAFIVTMGPDMLFGREIDSTEFRGVTALTAFPLLPRGQDWTTATNSTLRHAHRIFSSGSMEGTYLAARFIMTDPKTGFGEPRPYLHPSKADIPDYKPPFWTCVGPQCKLAPSTWLSVVGRNGYWPLAVLTVPFTKTIPLRSNLAIVAAPNTTDASNFANAPIINQVELSLSPAWKLCCMLAVLAILLHFFACRYGWSDPNLSMFIQFAPLPGRRQLFLMGIGWGMIASVLVFMFLCCARILPYLRANDSLWVWTLAAFSLFAWLGAAHDLGSRACGDHGSSRGRRLISTAWIALPLVVIGVALWAGLRIFDYSDPNGVPTAYRGVHLTSGVSPMVSLLLMLSGFYWWFWHTLAGLALLGEGRPILPCRKNIPPVLARISDEMAENIEDFAKPLPTLTVGRGVFYVLPIVILAFQVFAFGPSLASSLDTILHSLENAPFNVLLHGMFATAFYLLVLESGQLLSTWLALKRLLLALNRTPLRRTFSALQGLSMYSLWSISGTSSRARYTIFSHQLESLHHLRNVIHSFNARQWENEPIRAAIDEACEQGRTFMEHRAASADFAMVNDQKARQIREDLCRCTERILKELILPEWSRETSTLDFEDAGEKARSGELLPLSEDEPIRRAEEFVCLIYVGYLQNLLAAMRTMVLTILGIFAALAFSLAFYPFTPRPTIVLSLLFLLLILGSVVGVVYAGLSRDTTLSHITRTDPGRLGSDFWVRLASFIGVPVIGLLAAQFPGITDFVASWIEPTLNAVK